MPTITTLNFLGQTEAALRFYAEAVGAETVFMKRFREMPDPQLAASPLAELIFHATFRIEGTEFMASDVGAAPGAKPAFAGFALLLELNSLEKGRRIFEQLGRGGRVIIPLAESAFTSWYGIVIDPFGVSWKINVDPRHG